MAKIPLSYIELHNPMFMQGSNLGSKISAKARGAKLYFDTELSVVWIDFKDKVAFVPMSNIASGDMLDPQSIVLEEPATKTAPPAITRARKAGKEDVAVTIAQAESNPIEMTDAEAHRAEVRARSANAHKAIPQPETQSDALIQQSRAVASGQVQVSDPTRPANGLTGVQVKPKAISHAQLKAQVAAETKTTL